MTQPCPEEQAGRYGGHERQSLPSVEDVPQNQHLIASLISKAPAPIPDLKFDSGSLHYGEALAAVKHRDEETWKRRSTTLLVSVDKGLSAARRVFVEPRSIRNASVPFVSAAPVGDILDKVLARIEGPPDTTYEGGIFWISVKFPEAPTEPPMLRFQTRIYHPNIDPNGNICADYQRWWSDPNLQVTCLPWRGVPGVPGSLKAPRPDTPSATATYIKDYETYCKTARSYTTKFARDQKPSTEAMDFEDALSLAGVPTGRPGLSTVAPSTQFCISSIFSNRSSKLGDNDEADPGDASSTTTSRRSFLPPGEEKELRSEGRILDGAGGAAVRRLLKRERYRRWPPAALDRWSLSS
ncbi:hypothetical protein ACJZ2D_014820 [Fusarium nematophilum]